MIRVIIPNLPLIEITDQIILFYNETNNEAHFGDKPSIWEQNMILLFLCSAVGWHIKEDFESTRQWIYPPDPWSFTVFQSKDKKLFKKSFTLCIAETQMSHLPPKTKWNMSFNLRSSDIKLDIYYVIWKHIENCRNYYFRFMSSCC